ncbi:MAG: prolipoprotein diacylglyceryl transferase [Methylacidiphilales bacterium]|nr:prolipoprotein diacylglyceryl transferase [Candidatus Methylacidiphilales bacterium]MDW8349734.1 prolipoprotein diacylglyceryl transferase [Verrucomicrobiae bacterium]
MSGYYVHDLRPFLIEFSEGVGIRYYGLAYVLGFVWLYWVLGFFQRRGWLSLGRGNRDELLFYVAMLGVIVGGRLGYAIIYDWGKTVRDPLSIFRVWEGGMASHGGILGVIVVLLIYARWRAISFWSLADAVAWAAPLAIGLGRVANFINGELWGRPSQVPWAVIFPQAPLVDGMMVPRHPSQLYEALFEGFLLFGILAWVRLAKSEIRPGTLSVLFIVGYSVARIGCEFFREPDEGHFVFSGITMGQLLTGLLLLGLMIGLGVVHLLSHSARAKEKP